MLSLQLVLEKSERQDLIHEKTRLAEEYQISLKKLREDLASSQSALRDAEERQEAALKLESSAHSEVAAHQKTAQEAREKYETELRLHAQVERRFSCPVYLHFLLSFTQHWIFLSAGCTAVDGSSKAGRRGTS